MTLVNSIINPVAKLLWNLKICDNVYNQEHGFTSQQNIDAVLKYSKVPVTIQSYFKAQSYAKAVAAL